MRPQGPSQALARETLHHWHCFSCSLSFLIFGIIRLKLPVSVLKVKASLSRYYEGMLGRKARPNFRAFQPFHALLTRTPKQTIASWHGTPHVLRVLNPFVTLGPPSSQVGCGFMVGNTGEWPKSENTHLAPSTPRQLRGQALHQEDMLLLVRRLCLVALAPCRWALPSAGADIVPFTRHLVVLNLVWRHSVLQVGFHLTQKSAHIKATKPPIAPATPTIYNKSGSERCFIGCPLGTSLSLPWCMVLWFGRVLHDCARVLRSPLGKAFWGCYASGIGFSKHARALP